MLRTIQEIRPAWVIGENVAGILTMVQPGKETEVGSQTSLFGEDNRKRILLRQEYVVETICKDLEREGYSVQPLLIPACAVGAPHRRDRVWFVAHRTDARLEDVRRTREDDILSAGNVTDSNSKKLQERIKVRRRKNQEKAGTRVDDGVERFGNMRYAPYSDNERLQVFNISQRNDAENGKLRNDTLSNIPVMLGEHCTQRPGTTSQLNPLFVEEMMGFPLMWTTLPFLSQNGDRNQLKDMETP